MHILVTGGTGFLGGALVNTLRQSGHKVRVLGRNPQRCRQLAAAGIEVFQGELTDAPLIERACDSIHRVIHVAAFSAPWGKRQDFFDSNVRGTAHVIAACRRHHIQRLVHVSSPVVVFTGTDHILGTESAPCATRFLCHYAWSKTLAEDLVRKAHLTGLPSVILRPKAIFGPGDTTLLPRLVDAARAGRLRQIGDGTNLVDLTYVDNVVHALTLALDAPAAPGNTYTITNGEHVPLWQTLREVLQNLGIPHQLKPIPYAVAYKVARLMELRARLFGGEPPLTRYAVAILARTQTYDISAAQRDLNYRPLISFAEGIQRTLDELRSQPKGPHAL